MEMLMPDHTEAWTNGLCFAYHIFEGIIWNGHDNSLITISLKFVPDGPINNDTIDSAYDSPRLLRQGFC